MRFDVALHGLRLFKSRSQASAAIDQGRALLNGRPGKASLTVRQGDRITLVGAAVGAAGTRTLEILELPRPSLSKEDAKRLVRDVGPSAAGAPGRSR